MNLSTKAVHLIQKIRIALVRLGGDSAGIIRLQDPDCVTKLLQLCYGLDDPLLSNLTHQLQGELCGGVQKVQNGESDDGIGDAELLESLRTIFCEYNGPIGGYVVDQAVDSLQGKPLRANFMMVIGMLSEELSDEIDVGVFLSKCKALVG